MEALLACHPYFIFYMQQYKRGFFYMHQFIYTIQYHTAIQGLSPVISSCGVAQQSIGSLMSDTDHVWGVTCATASNQCVCASYLHQHPNQAVPKPDSWLMQASFWARQVCKDAVGELAVMVTLLTQMISSNGQPICRQEQRAARLLHP